MAGLIDRSRHLEYREFLPYCEQHGIAVLVRGPLAMGLLSGKYTEQSVFTDTVRAGWNAGGAGRTQFEERILKLNKIGQVMHQGEDLATTALRFVISHPIAPVAIPGAKSPEQAAANAKAGDLLITKLQLDRFG